jgi:hypothetical protein
VRIIEDTSGEMRKIAWITEDTFLRVVDDTNRNLVTNCEWRLCFLKSVHYYRRCRPEHYTTDYIVTAPRATAFAATHFPAPSYRWTCNRYRGCHCSLPLTTIDTLVIFQQTCPAVVFDRFQKESTLRLMRYCHRQSKIVCKIEESHDKK